MSYWIENHDKLGRAEESEYIIRFLQQRVAERIGRGKTGSYVLNIDATWGEGKTFFMKGLFDDLKEAGHPAIMIDAWRDDFSDDPLTAVVAEFDQFLTKFKSSDRSLKTKVKAAGKEFRRNVGKLSLLTAKGIAKRATTYVVGEAAGEIAETAKNIVSGYGEFENIVDDATGEVIKIAEANIDKFAERKLAQFNEAKLSLDTFQTSLGKTVGVLTAKTYTPPFFILIDELDRCRPTYAIEMLERIKHLFEVENVVFILATDTTQLANSIKAVYGSEFDSRHYLSRFFDRSYMLAAPERFEMVAYLFENASLDIHNFATTIEIGHFDLINKICSMHNLEIRQIERAIDLLATINAVWDEKCQIELAIMLPMIVAFLKGNNLRNEDQLREAFSVNDQNIYISGVNLHHFYRNLAQFSKVHLYNLRNRVEQQYGRLGYNRPELDAETNLAITVLGSELEIRRPVHKLPLFTTYADRIRMAGRFFQSDVDLKMVSD